MGSPVLIRSGNASLYSDQSKKVSPSCCSVDFDSTSTCSAGPREPAWTVVVGTAGRREECDEQQQDGNSPRTHWGSCDHHSRKPLTYSDLVRKQLAIDVVAVVAFCAVGRRSHAEASSIAGLAGTVWPFLAGLAVGWLVVSAMHRDPIALVPGGVLIWLSTLTVGMILRVVSGQGTALSFIVVAGVVLGTFLLGSRGIGRLITAIVHRRRQHRTHA